MKKTLLAAALLAGYAGAASAQNTVTLYGVVSTGLEYQSITGDGESASRVRMDTGEWNGSRWGLKGTESLGNGLNASFVLESGFDSTDGDQAQGGRLFGRRATLALSNSAWGKIEVGRSFSPGTAAMSGIDPFGVSFGTSSLTSSQSTAFIRYDDMITYATPSFSGFKAIAGYSFDPGLTSNSAGSAFDTNAKTRVAAGGLRYSNGPILLSGSIDYVLSNTLNDGGDIAGIDNDTNVTAWALGAAYDFKVAKLHGSYGQQTGGLIGLTDDVANLLVAGGSDAEAGSVLFARGVRTQNWMVGLTAPVGSGLVMASVHQELPGGSLDVDGAGNQTTASIGYQYNLSKRTGVYGYYSYQDNVAMIDGVKSNMVGVGVRHKF